MSETQTRDAAPEWSAPVGDSLPVEVPESTPAPAPAAVVETPAPVVAEPPAAPPAPAAPVPAASPPAPAAEPPAAASETPAPAGQDALRDRFFAGAGVRFKGELEVCSDLVLSGSFEGTARSRRLIVSREGVFNGACLVEEAEIEGTAEGNLTVTGTLNVRASGVVKGKICYGGIALERGAHIEGELVKYVPATEPAKAPAAHAADPVLVELSTADILEEPRARPAPPPAEAASRRRFGIFGAKR